MVTVVAIGPGGAKAGYAAVNATQPVALLILRTQPTDVVAGEAIDQQCRPRSGIPVGAVVSGYPEAVTIGADSGPAGAEFACGSTAELPSH